MDAVPSTRPLILTEEGFTLMVFCKLESHISLLLNNKIVCKQKIYMHICCLVLALGQLHEIEHLKSSVGETLLSDLKIEILGIKYMDKYLQ